MTISKTTTAHIEQTLKRLGAENALFRLAIEELPLGLSMFDANDTLILTNARYSEIWEIPEYLLRPGATFEDIIQLTPGEETQESCNQPEPEPNSSGTRQREWRLHSGKIIEVTVTRMTDGSAVALHRDVTQRRQAEEESAYLASHDPTTALYNRHGLEEALKRQLDHVDQTNKLALLYLDLDRFKSINDGFGHAVGDKLLKNVARRIKFCASKGSLLARLGGDEFIIAHPVGPQLLSTEAMSQRLIQSISTPYSIAGHHINIGASVGSATAPDDATNIESLLNYADLALHRAKVSGRGRYRHFEPQMDEAAKYRRRLKNELGKALAQDQLQLVFQPIVKPSTGEICAVEALLRWHHPEEGSISPAEFIPIAEETGLILDIGRWVLQRACACAATWADNISVAVNVSTIQLLQSELRRDITDALQKYRLPASRLEIELTESVMIENPCLAAKKLSELVSLGVKLAVDDFGTGYSALSYLHGYPFNRIKIDRSFIADIQASEKAKTIVQAMITLSLNLGLQVTVEGVETQEQMHFAQASGATEAQGYFISKPVPVDVLNGLWQDRLNIPINA